MYIFTICKWIFTVLQNNFQFTGILCTYLQFARYCKVMYYTFIYTFKKVLYTYKLQGTNYKRSTLKNTRILSYTYTKVYTYKKVFYTVPLRKRNSTLSKVFNTFILRGIIHLQITQFTPRNSFTFRIYNTIYTIYLHLEFTIQFTRRNSITFTIS